MKILVMSDSHGREMYVYEIMRDNAGVDVVIHLGDGEDDMDFALSELPAYNNKKLIRVKGNCDGYSALPETSYDNIAGYRFLSTHGYRQTVKSGIYRLWDEAEKNNRNVVLFGHTHEQFYEEKDGIHFFNPGAVKDLNYGLIEIDEKTGKMEFVLK